MTNTNQLKNPIEAAQTAELTIGVSFLDFKKIRQILFQLLNEEGIAKSIYHLAYSTQIEEESNKITTFTLSLKVALVDFENTYKVYLKSENDEHHSFEEFLEKLKNIDLASDKIYTYIFSNSSISTIYSLGKKMTTVEIIVNYIYNTDYSVIPQGKPGTDRGNSNGTF